MKPLLALLVCLTIPRISINHYLKVNHVSHALRNRIKNKGFIHVNGCEVPWSTPIVNGDLLEIFLPPEKKHSTYNYPLSILYEDDYFLAINKPAGMLMHPTSSERNKTLANALLYYYDLTNQILSFHPIHRLDKDTSGIVLVAKNALVQHAFHQQQLHIVKTYTAFVNGLYPIKHSTIKFPIIRKDDSIIERTVSTHGAFAHTDITCIQRNERASLLHLVLHTGKTHQIRVHCASMGYPLLGDDLYGGPTNYISRQALHASELSFYHPITKDYLCLKAPFPKDLQELKRLLFT